MSRNPRSGRGDRAWRGLAALAAAFAAACGGDRGGYVMLYEEPPEETRNIDLGAGIELEDDGVGLAVEAFVGGQWRFTTSCDAWRGRPPCLWDIVASVDPAKDLSTDSPSFDEGDFVRQVDRGAVRIVFVTGVGPAAGDAGASDAGTSDGAGTEAGAKAATGLSDLDEVVLNAPPGEPLRVDVMLDGAPDGRFVSWTEGGAIRAGLPSNPVVLVPTSP